MRGDGTRTHSRCCSARRARRQPHLSAAPGNFRLSTLAAQLPGEGPAPPPTAPPGLARTERSARAWTVAELRSGCSESPAASARFPPLTRSGEGRRRASGDRERWPETPPAAAAGGQLGQLGQRTPGPAAPGSGGVSRKVDAFPGRRQFENNNNNKMAISWDTSQLFQPNAHYHSWNTLL